MTEKKLPAKKPYPLGAHCEEGGVRFSFVSGKENCGIILYDRVTGKKLKKLTFTKEERIGRIYCKYIADLDGESIAYQFYEDDTIIEDERARGFVGKTAYGRERREKDMKARVCVPTFDWEKDCNPRLPYEDCMFYCLHVRGFTRHPSSGVAHKGTFLGVTEKLEYLKEIGVTTVELQPAYEFLEIPGDRQMQKTQKGNLPVGEDVTFEKKLNYWGYQKGYYYTPKAAYAAGEDATLEFKKMVKTFHKNHMEVVMQFYFPKEFPAAEIPEILRFWVLEYHVDGFHLMGESIPADLIAGDAMLSETKLLFRQFQTEAVYAKDEIPAYCNLAQYQDDYLYVMRKFLKGDDNMLGNVLYQMRHIPQKCGRIHYMSNYNGFTLKDMVSYDHKHNEDNGEGNRDGNDYNCSWNCGEEGVTRKKKVLQLRLRQIKNAMCMLMFSQSTPLIFMGDEFGNSQQGNNNPYCQDNRIAWLDWKDLERNQELLQFWKQLAALRREHPILHPERELKIMDYISCGYPDLSYHGQSAWRPGLEQNFRHVGMMYCGKYARKEKNKEDDFFYVAMNMHWEPHELALPKLPKGMEWEVVISTGEKDNSASIFPVKTEGQDDEMPRGKEVSGKDKSMCRLTARSIVVFQSVQQKDVSGVAAADKKKKCKKK